MFTLNELLQRQNESLHQLPQIATESPCLSEEQIDGLYILNKYKSCRFCKAYHSSQTLFGPGRERVRFETHNASNLI